MPTAKVAFKQQVHGLTSLAQSPLAVAQNEPGLLQGFVNDQEPSQGASKCHGHPTSILVTHPHNGHFTQH